MLHAISPVDGRYADKTRALSAYFSEFGLIHYRVRVEIDYLLALLHFLKGKNAISISLPPDDKIKDIYLNFSEKDALRIKDIEKTTNHDVKAVEYFIKEKLDDAGYGACKEFVHFGLTSQDINNTAIPLSHRECQENVIIPAIRSVLDQINFHAGKYKGLPMLARTHGQPASPTTLGKEFLVFSERLENQLAALQQISILCKFGGATGNLNAHKVAYPDYDWVQFSEELCLGWGLQRSKHTTQIAHYDDLADLAHNFMRINTILIDFCRDIWSYISMEYFSQKVVAGEIGSSAMPHKVNPIDFENAEGNLGVANALFGHLAEKLPVSRLQRDLTDSTVLRNWGVPFAHVLIACASLQKGLSKIIVNPARMEADLDNNWAVVAEAIQNVLRKEGIANPYEMLKDLTRGKAGITKEDIRQFIDGLAVNDDIKKYLHSITPFNYTGYF